MRAPYQVLVIPFSIGLHGAEFAALKRADDGKWQAIAGGGEAGESPAQTALREAIEEFGLETTSPLYRLQATASIPREYFAGRASWPTDLYVIPEHAFAVQCNRSQVRLSVEHVACEWGTYEHIHELLHWESNKVALWELSERLKAGQLIRVESGSGRQ